MTFTSQQTADQALAEHQLTRQLLQATLTQIDKDIAQQVRKIAQARTQARTPRS